VDALAVVASDEEDELGEVVERMGNLVSEHRCEVVIQERGATLPGDLRRQ
jgi:hypothetical protein